MKVRGKVTPKMRARVLELRGQVDEKGRPTSLRVIEAKLASEGMQLSYIGVRDICEAAKASQGAKGESGAEQAQEQGEGRVRGGARGRRGDGEVEGEEDGTGGEEASEEALVVQMPVLPEGASVAAVACWEDLREVRATATTLRAKVLTGDYPATQWAQLKGVALRLMKTLHELLPPPKPDPSKDPTNIGAREAVHAHVLRAIEGAEARLGLLCPRCRGNLET